MAPKASGLGVAPGQTFTMGDSGLVAGGTTAAQRQARIDAALAGNQPQMVSRGGGGSYGTGATDDPNSQDPIQELIARLRGLNDRGEHSIANEDAKTNYQNILNNYSKKQGITSPLEDFISSQTTGRPAPTQASPQSGGAQSLMDRMPQTGGPLQAPPMSPEDRQRSDLHRKALEIAMHVLQGGQLNLPSFFKNASTYK